MTKRLAKKQTFPVYGALIGVALSAIGYRTDPYIAAGVAPYGYVNGTVLLWPVVGWFLGYVAGRVRDRWAAEAREKGENQS